MLTETTVQLPKDILENAAKDIKEFVDIKNSINQPCGNFFYDKWEIKPQFKNTIWQELLSYFLDDIGEARIIKLESGKCYLQHADIDDRYHLNISGENSYLIDIDLQEMHHLKNNGRIYEMNAGKIHSAVNLGVYDRYQLVVRKLLTKNTIKDDQKMIIKPVCDKPRFVFDNEVSPVLNMAHKQKIISNFEILDDGVSLSVKKGFSKKITENLSDKIKVTLL